MNLTNSMKKFGIEQTFKYVYKDPETNLRKLMDWGDSFANGSFPAQRALIRRIIEDENHPYHAYILHMFNDIDVSVMTKISENFFYQCQSCRLAHPAGTAGEVQLQYSLGDPAGSHQRLQPALHRLLGG